MTATQKTKICIVYKNTKHRNTAKIITHHRR